MFSFDPRSPLTPNRAQIVPINSHPKAGAPIKPMNRASKDQINIRTLQHLISGIPLVLGLGTRMPDQKETALELVE